MEPGLTVSLFTCPRCGGRVTETLVTGSKQEHGVAFRDLKRRFPEHHQVVVHAGARPGTRHLWVRCPDAPGDELGVPSDSALGVREVAAAGRATAGAAAAPAPSGVGSVDLGRAGGSGRATGAAKNRA